MREKEEPSAIWREEKEPVRPNTYLQKNKENSTKKPAEMEQQLKQQLMQKKNYANLSQKKKKVQFFPSYHSQKIVLPTMKKNTIHHHIKKVAYTFQNDIQSYQRTVLKLFMKKKRKVYAQNQQQKKTLTKSHQFI